MFVLVISVDGDEVQSSSCVPSVERLMCCEVEFFWEVCFEECASGLFSLNVVPVGFHALLPDS